MSNFSFLQLSYVAYALAFMAFGFSSIYWGRKLYRERMTLLRASGSSYTQWQSAILSAFVLFLLIIALLRPTLGFQEVRVEGQSLKHVFIIDISRSMLAADQKPNRLQQVKRKILQLLDQLERQEKQHAVGLVIFSGSAHAYLPSTKDYEVVRTMVRALDNSLIAQQGSALKNALALALRLSQAEDAILPPQFILFSDGEDKSLSLDDVRSMHESSQFNLHVFGFGTSKGAPIPAGDGRFVKDSNDNIVITKQDVPQLKNLAKIGNGFYFNSRLDNSDVLALIQRINQSQSQASEQTLRTYNEYFFYPLFFALLIITVAVWFRIPHVVFLLIFLVASKKSYADETDYSAAQ
ncbi:MAG: VWA domain-containing protein, partial [Bdellovibrionales bacterium]|nr:VWA domain-containing protein [Bdellovibrionales bacterium]